MDFGNGKIYPLYIGNINVHQNSYLRQPDIFTPNVQQKQYGMVYLDDGSNTTTGNPKYRSYKDNWEDM